jgi:hypothetical protein
MNHQNDDNKNESTEETDVVLEQKNVKKTLLTKATTTVTYLIKLIPNIVENIHERNVDSRFPNIQEDIIMLLVCWCCCPK